MMTNLLISIFLILLSANRLSAQPESKHNSQSGKTDESVTTASISIVGDLMCHSTQFNYAKVNADSFDFTGVYSEIKPYIKSADLRIGNLETVFAGESEGYSGYPFFNAPDEFAHALKDAGFNLLITANNHALDQGEDGVLRTIEQINKNGIHHTGTFTSEKDRDSVRIFGIRGILIAVLAYSENTNDIPIPKGKSYLINLIDEERIKDDIAKLRARNVDIVLVHFHYGPEYNREPSNHQKEIVSKTIDAGADIIIGGHPHVIQPFDFFETNGGKLDTGFVAYSMGNFISNQRWRYSDAGVILNIEVAKNKLTDSVYFENVSYLPTWVFKGSTDMGKEYIILPSENSESDSSYYYLTKSDKRKMKQAFDDTKSIITKYSSKPDLISPVRNEETTLHTYSD